MATVFDEGFVEAYSKSTGKIQVIPEHYLDHPVLGKNFSKTPSQKAREAASDQPSESWTHAQLDDYAGDDIDLSGATTKADKVAAIQAAEAARIPRDPDGAPRSDAENGADQTDPA